MGAFTQSGVTFVAKNFGKYQSTLAKADKAQQKLGKTAGQGARGVGQLNQAFKGVAGVSATTFALGAVTSGLVAFGRAAIEEGRAFSKAMSNVKAISGATGKEFAALEKQARQLGATTKFTAIEAAEGQTFLAQAGFETNEIIGALPGTLNLAAASNLDLGTSADIVSNILTGFGATAESTGQFVDVLTNTFTTSNTDLTQLGQAMKFAAPIAKSLGLSVEETSAAVGTLSNAGIQGALAGTTLRGVLLSLSAPTGKAKDEMERLGIELFNSKGELLPLPEIINRVSAATAGMSDEQRIASLKTLVGTKRLAGLEVLLNSGGDALEKYTSELSKSGTASEIAAKQLDNLEGDITLLQSAFSGFKLAAFELMEPTLRGASQALTGLLGELNEGADAWNQVFTEQIPTIRSWQAEQAKAAAEVQKINPALAQYRVNIQAATPIIDETTQSTEELTDASKELVTTTEKVESGVKDLAESQIELVDVETDEAQQVAELNRLRNAGLFTVDEATISQNALTTEIRNQTLAREAAIEAERREIDMLTTLAGTQADFFTGIKDAREEAITSEKDFNASISSIRASANEAQTTAQESLNDKLVELDEQRQEKIHFVLTGAHARTQAENDNALAFWNDHFDQLEADERASFADRQAEIDADLLAREGKAREAREKELAEQQAHLEELKLNAALATLESTGQLAQFTGGLAVSANEAAQLIRAGVLPVTDELALAVQSTLAGLQEQEAQAATQATSNQALLQEAYAGTLTPIQEQEMALGTSLPTAALIAQESMGIMNQEVALGVQNATLAIQNEDLALQNVSGVTVPSLQESMGLMNEDAQIGLGNTLLATQSEDLALQTIAGSTLPALDKAFVKTAKAGVKAAMDIKVGWDDVIGIMEELKAIVESVTRAFEDMKNAAVDASQIGRTTLEGMASSAGVGLSSGLGFRQGIGFQAGTLGFEIPPGFPNDSFPIRVESGEEVLVAPASSSIDEIVMNAFGLGSSSVMVEVNVGTIQSPMDLGIVTEQIRRVVAEETN